VDSNCHSASPEAVESAAADTATAVVILYGGSASEAAQAAKLATKKAGGSAIEAAKKAATAAGETAAAYSASASEAGQVAAIAAKQAGATSQDAAKAAGKAAAGVASMSVNKKTGKPSLLLRTTRDHHTRGHQNKQLNVSILQAQSTTRPTLARLLRLLRRLQGARSQVLPRQQGSLLVVCESFELLLFLEKNAHFAIIS
jgi:hypothetical protein